MTAKRGRTKKKRAAMKTLCVFQCAPFDSLTYDEQGRIVLEGVESVCAVDMCEDCADIVFTNAALDIEEHEDDCAGWGGSPIHDHVATPEERARLVAASRRLTEQA